MHPSDDSKPWNHAWRELLHASPFLAEPVLRPLPSPKGIDVSSTWEAARRYLTDPSALASGQLRLYEQGKKGSLDSDVIERLKQGPEEGLVFLNQAERWLGPTLPDALAWCEPLAEVFPVDHFARELHLIAGRYLATPFGIHVDSPLERVVHLNLGPGTKTFFLWPEEQFVAATNSRAASHDLEKHLPWATVFEIRPGMGFVLPERWYHVATSSEVSHVFAVTIRRRTKTAVTQACATWLGALLQSGQEEEVPAFDSPLSKGLALEQSRQQLPLDHLMLEAYDLWRQQTARARGFDSLADRPSPTLSIQHPLHHFHKRRAMTDEINKDRLSIEDLELEADPGSLLEGPRRDTGGVTEDGEPLGAFGSFVLSVGEVRLEVPHNFESNSLKRLLSVLSQAQLGQIRPDALGPRRDTGPREELLGPRRDTGPREELLGPRRDTGPREELLGPRRDTGPREELLGPRRDTGPREELLGPRRDTGPREELLGPRRDTGPREELLGPRRDTGPREELLGPRRDTGPREELLGPRRDTGPREELLGPRRDTGPREELLGPRRDTGPREELLGPRRDTGPREELLGPRRDTGPREELLGPRRDTRSSD